VHHLPNFTMRAFAIFAAAYFGLTSAVIEEHNTLRTMSTRDPGNPALGNGVSLRVLPIGEYAPLVTLVANRKIFLLLL